MAKKVTTSDISRKLGISRNTVSKALNNHPSISEETRTKVINEARAMGYKKMAPVAAALAPPSGLMRNIACLTRKDVSTSGYWMNLISGVEEVLRGSGYDMKMSFIKDEDVASHTLPPLLNNAVDGFIVAGTVDRGYAEKLLALSLPKVFVDWHAELPLTDLGADLVVMESEEAVYRITRHLLDSGHSDIGFIGDITSRSLFERWKGFARAHHEGAVPLKPIFSITAKHSTGYQSFEGVAAALSALDRLPTALVCANDLTALHAFRFAKEQGMRVPDDIAISGFDQIKETNLLDISLTTVVNSEFHLGLRAAEQLLYRMKRQQRPFEVIRVATSVVFGESTRPTRA